MIPPQHRKKAAALAIAISIAAPAEGLRQYAYYDPPGILTVCRGHTGSDVVKGKKYSLEECDRFFDGDMRAAIAKVDRCAPGLPDQVRGAFGDAVYNLGETIACDTTHSTAARLLQVGQLAGACNELPKWNKATIAGVKVALPGLTTRRERERAVCLEGLA